MRFDIVLNNLTAWAFTSGEVLLKSDGTPWRPLVHIEDIARAFIMALAAPRELVHDQAFNIGSTSANYQMRELPRSSPRPCPLPRRLRRRRRLPTPATTG